MLQDSLQQQSLPHLGHLLSRARNGRLRNNPVHQTSSTAARLVGVHVNSVITGGGGAADSKSVRKELNSREEIGVV